MADQELSDLTALTGANLASGDLFHVVDVSDTTMSAEGTDKKITGTELGIGLAALMAGVVGGPPVIVIKAADETVTSSTTVQDDNHLVHAISAGTTWRYEFELYAYGAEAGDLKVTVVAPTAATGWINGSGLISTATGATSDLVSGGTETFGVEFTRGLNNSPSVGRFWFAAYVVNPTNAGSVKLQWAQGTSNGTGTTVKAGSLMRAYRVA